MTHHKVTKSTKGKMLGQVYNGLIEVHEIVSSLEVFLCVLCAFVVNRSLG